MIEFDYEKIWNDIISGNDITKEVEEGKSLYRLRCDRIKAIESGWIRLLTDDVSNKLEVYIPVYKKEDDLLSVAQSNSKYCILDRIRNRMVKDFRKKYKLDHKCCPKCGDSSNYNITLVGYILDVDDMDSYKDNNRCSCSCGDVHTYHERVPKV